MCGQGLVVRHQAVPWTINQCSGLGQLVCVPRPAESSRVRCRVEDVSWLKKLLNDPLDKCLRLRISSKHSKHYGDKSGAKRKITMVLVALCYTYLYLQINSILPSITLVYPFIEQGRCTTQ